MILSKALPILFFSMSFVCANVQASNDEQELSKLELSGDTKEWTDYYARSTQLLAKDDAFLQQELQALNLSAPEKPTVAKTFGVDPNQSLEWFDTEDSKHIMENILSFQTPSGGWSKRTDMSQPRKKGQAFGTETDYIPTFDNDATSTQITLLAKAFTATRNPKYQKAFDRGLAFVIAAQYPNGGWPQNFPLRGGYHNLITYNDNLMRDLLQILKQVSDQQEPFAFVSRAQQEAAKKSLALGIDCLLKSQVKQNNLLTIWGAQHDLKNFAPAKARAFEMPALATMESSYLMSFLMSVENPSPEIIAAVHAAADWFESTKIIGKTWHSGDTHLTDDPQAKPLWARFYDVASNQPVFGDRDNSVHASIAEISEERRKGYAWYGTAPNRALDEYKIWSASHPDSFRHSRVGGSRQTSAANPALKNNEQSQQLDPRLRGDDDKRVGRASNDKDQCVNYLGNSFLRNCQTWATGFEGQRKADLGNGFYLNPIMAGDHPDPNILKDGDDYYMVFSSFEAYPALNIWHSKDLVNWQPIGPAVTKYIGSIWAPELTKYRGKYFLYIPAKMPGNNNIYVVTANNIRGPWSEPVALNNDRIDPGHIVGEDGNRYLFLSHGDRVRLSKDGLKIEGPIEHVYDGWQYPEEWDVENFAQEGPKMMKHGDYFYMTLALGGTAGPPTGHMVVSARAKSINGPWENSPYNPIIRTESPAEKWWSKGHATLVEGPSVEDLSVEGPSKLKNKSEWYMVYHAYENGFHTLGRQTLLEPIEWTADGWFKAKGFDPGQPIPKPQGGIALQHGMSLSDDFTKNKFGIQWSFFKGDVSENQRVAYENSSLVLTAKGDSPSNSSPLTFIVGDQAYEFEVDIDFDEDAQAGVLLFYNDKLYAGVGFNKKGIVLHRYGMDQRTTPKIPGMENRVRVRVKNNRHIMTVYTSIDEGKTWGKYSTQWEVSGYNHNVAYGFMSLRPALYVSGIGKARFKNFVYRALP